MLRVGSGEREGDEGEGKGERKGGKGKDLESFSSWPNCESVLSLSLSLFRQERTPIRQRGVLLLPKRRSSSTWARLPPSNHLSLFHPTLFDKLATVAGARLKSASMRELVARRTYNIIVLRIPCVYRFRFQEWLFH
jgi:hypothetical protein